MASQHRWIARVVEKLEAQGWRSRYGSKHVVLYPADPSHRCFTIAMTPGDRNSLKNTLREIRNSGGRI